MPTVDSWANTASRDLAPIPSVAPGAGAAAAAADVAAGHEPEHVPAPVLGATARGIHG